jgi:uroporphyrinogen decarboxylase
MKTMSPKERVLTAIRHQETDRLPRGELLVEEAFLDRLCPDKTDFPYREKMMHFAKAFDLDLVTIAVGGKNERSGLEEVSRWVDETPYFVLALVDGLFWKQEDPLSFQELILGIARGEGRVRDLFHSKKGRAITLIQRCLDKGAHGVIIGDDLAYDQGPFISPEDLGQWVFLGLQEMVKVIKEGNGIAFLHSCGNLTRIVDQIISAGFDGLHGLAPTSGNDPLSIREKAHRRMAVMGIFDLDSMSPGEIQAVKQELLPSLSAGGGYILGSAAGLSENTPLDSFGALYSETPSPLAPEILS